MPGTCIPGCFCPDGLVRKGDKCVKPNECRDCEYSTQSLRTASFLCSITIIHTNETVKTVMKENSTLLFQRDLTGLYYSQGYWISGFFTI
jgi:hypothetical protein